jgi:hypothetical protein
MRILSGSRQIEIAGVESVYELVGGLGQTGALKEVG